MAYLMHIDVTNSVRLDRRIYYFEYEGIRFKFIQNDPHKYADVLITILPNHDDKAAEDRAFATASKFVSALAWSNGSTMAVEPHGGMGCPGNHTLRAARCRMFGLPHFFNMGNVYGFDIATIAAIETPEQQRALALFREATSSNKPMLSLLLYWQVMDVRPSPKAVEWVNSEYSTGKVNVSDHESKFLDLRGRSLGDYLEDDCRHAIAHLRRFPSKRLLLFDDLPDLGRIGVSANVAARFAGRYIREVLGLSKRMTLVRQRKGGFPVYMKDGTIPYGRYVLAYPSRPRRFPPRGLAYVSPPLPRRPPAHK
jgi:hypothetical protein